MTVRIYTKSIAEGLAGWTLTIGIIADLIAATKFTAHSAMM
jgi:hypothetical protein